jgi:uncharacterized protein (TIGR02246 family)
LAIKDLDNEALDNKVIQLERAYWDAMRQQDADAALNLTDETCIVVGAQGINELGRSALAAMIRGAPYKLEYADFAEADIQTKAITDDVVVIAYKIDERLVVDGKEVELQAYDSSVWVRRDDGWHCALHTESLPGDPFGRT